MVPAWMSVELVNVVTGKPATPSSAIQASGAEGMKPPLATMTSMFSGRTKGQQREARQGQVAKHGQEHHGARRHVQQRTGIADAVTKEGSEQQQLEAQAGEGERPPADVDLRERGHPAAGGSADQQADDDGVQQEHQASAQGAGSHDTGRSRSAGTVDVRTAGTRTARRGGAPNRYAQERVPGGSGCDRLPPVPSQRAGTTTNGTARPARVRRRPGWRAGGRGMRCGSWQAPVGVGRLGGPHDHPADNPPEGPVGTSPTTSTMRAAAAHPPSPIRTSTDRS